MNSGNLADFLRNISHFRAVVRQGFSERLLTRQDSVQEMGISYAYFSRGGVPASDNFRFARHPPRIRTNQSGSRGAIACYSHYPVPEI